jgi:hypothetical protein
LNQNNPEVPKFESAREEYLAEINREVESANIIIGGGSYQQHEDQIILQPTYEQIEEIKRRGPDTTAQDKRRTEPKNKILSFNIGLQQIEVSNRPLCSFVQLLQAKRKTEKILPELIEGLPREHPWREAKLSHEVVVLGGTKEIFEEIGDCFTEENYYLLLFIASVHDIGRIIEAKKQSGIESAEQYESGLDHGKYSISILERYGILDLFDKKTQEIIRYSIHHHSDRKMPVLEKQAGEEDCIAYIFTGLLRDMDKVGIFVGKTDKYIHNEEEKKKQIEANNLIKGEAGAIIPKSLIDDFENKNTLDRNKCESYEAFMLQYLAWIFDINTEPGKKGVVESQFINKVLKYLENQLDSSEYERIESTIRDFTSS